MVLNCGFHQSGTARGVISAVTERGFFCGIGEGIASKCGLIQSSTGLSGTELLRTNNIKPNAITTIKTPTDKARSGVRFFIFPIPLLCSAQDSVPAEDRPQVSRPYYIILHPIACYSAKTNLHIVSRLANTAPAFGASVRLACAKTKRADPSSRLVPCLPVYLCTYSSTAPPKIHASSRAISSGVNVAYGCSPDVNLRMIKLLVGSPAMKSGPLTPPLLASA